MAIVQISRITNRSGLTENLPQLAGAELGWCIDTRRLFIGNGTIQDGAPTIGNTEILTEYSDILEIAARNSGQTVLLEPTLTPTEIFSISTDDTDAFTMQYRYKDDLNLMSQYGTLEVLGQDGDDLASTLTYTNDYSTNNPTGLVLSVSQNDTIISVWYTLDPMIADGGNLRYSLNYFR